MNVKLNAVDKVRAIDISRALIAAFTTRMNSDALDTNPSRVCRHAGKPEFRNAFYAAMRNGITSIEMAVKMASLLGLRIKVQVFAEPTEAPE
jgi:hypothetical protein